MFIFTRYNTIYHDESNKITTRIIEYGNDQQSRHSRPKELPIQLENIKEKESNLKTEPKEQRFVLNL